MQPNSGYQYKRVSGTAAGTTVIQDHNGVLKGYLIGQNKTGTITIYDNATGTTADSLLSVINNNSGSIPLSADLQVRFKDGLVAETGGTTDILFIYQ